MSQDVIFIVYITAPSQEVAAQLANHLLEKKLVACANMFPVESMHWWNHSIEKGSEVVLLVKTFAHIFSAIRQEIARIHPYQTPVITGFPAHANQEYCSYMSTVIECKKT